MASSKDATKSHEEACDETLWSRLFQAILGKHILKWKSSGLTSFFILSRRIFILI